MSPHRDAVELPQRDVGRVLEELDFHRLGVCRFGDGHGVQRFCLGQVFVCAGGVLGDVPRLAGGRLVCVCLVVIHRCYGVGLTVGGAVGQVGTHPESRVRFADIGGHEDVGALTHAEDDHVGFVWLDRGEIFCDDGEGVAVDGETLDAIATGVDQAETVGLAGLEPELGDTSVVGAGRLVPRGNS